jgi:hypothetical protein
MKDLKLPDLDHSEDLLAQNRRSEINYVREESIYAGGIGQRFLKLKMELSSGLEFHRHFPLEYISARLQRDRQLEIEQLQRMFLLRIQNPYLGQDNNLKYLHLSFILGSHGFIIFFRFFQLSESLGLSFEVIISA